MFETLKNKKIYVYLLLIFIIFNVFMVLNKKITKDEIINIYNKDESGINVTICKDKSVKQDFSLYNNEMYLLTVITGNNNEILKNYTLDYIIKDDKETLLQNSIVLDGIGANTNININLGKNLTGLKDKKLTLIFSTESDEELHLVANKDNNIVLDAITNETTSYDVFAKHIGIYILITFIIISMCMFFRNIDTHNLYTIVVVVVGILYGIVIPIGNVPDEGNAHITTAYHYSNKMMGIEDNKESVKERSDDRKIYSYAYVDHAKFVKYLDDLQVDNENNELIDTDLAIMDMGISSFTYYPSAFGITIGRLLGLNGILCMMMGRMANFIIFVMVSRYCIKSIPIYKSILSFVCLLPITLQQTFSLSYDSMVITLAILVTTLSVKLYYNHKLSRKDNIVLFVSCGLLAVCKQFSYSPIVLVPIYYYYSNSNIHNRLVRLENRKKCVLLIMMCIISILLFLIIRNSFSEGTLLYLIGHPKQFYYYMRETLYYNLESMLFSMLGGSLGLLHLSVYTPIIICIFLLGLYILINYENNNLNYLTNQSRIVMFIVFLISFIGILLSMYAWSYKSGILNNGVILGFQGRYMLPVLPLMMISICKGEKYRSKINERIVINSSLFINSIVVLSLLITLS